MPANMYAFPSLLISILLLGLLVASIEIGYRIGRTRASTCADSVKEHIRAIESAVLGLLALLLAFTFSLALQRFDSRSEAVVDEANAVGTAFLRAELLPPPFREEAKLAISSYLDIRVGEAQVFLSDQADRQVANEAAGAAQVTIWGIGMRASAADNASRSTLLFVQAVNELIDSFGRRNAALDRHVPELVTLLLFATFLLAGAVMGYAAGVAAHRPSLAAYVLVGLMIVLVFVVLDLDRPRRGVIQVSHTSLTDLQATMHRELRGSHAPASAGIPK